MNRLRTLSSVPSELLNDVFYPESQRFVPPFVVSNWAHYYKKYKGDYYRRAQQNMGLLWRAADDYNVQHLETIEYLMREIPRNMSAAVRYYAPLNPDLAHELDLCNVKMMRILQRDRQKLLRLPPSRRTAKQYLHLLKPDERTAHSTPPPITTARSSFSPDYIPPPIDTFPQNPDFSLSNSLFHFS